jgi:hypothetical protein
MSAGTAQLDGDTPARLRRGHWDAMRLARRYRHDGQIHAAALALAAAIRHHMHVLYDIDRYHRTGTEHSS